MSALNEEILAPGEATDAEDVVDERKRRLFGRSTNSADSLQQEIDEAQAVLDAQALSPVDIVADFIRQRSLTGSLVAHETFHQPPYSISEQDLDEVMRHVFDSEACSDISVCQVRRNAITTRRRACRPTMPTCAFW